MYRNHIPFYFEFLCSYSYKLQITAHPYFIRCFLCLSREVCGKGLLVSHNLDLWWWVILFSVYCLWVLLPEIRLPSLAGWLATAAWVWLWLFCFSWESPLIGLLGKRNLFGNGDVGYLSKLPLIMENIKACSRISDQNELPIYSQ